MQHKHKHKHETWKRVLSEMDFPGPRNSGSGDSGYGFVDLGGQI